MPVGGYDPEDLDDTLSALMDSEERDASNWLTDDEIDQYEQGESLVDLLDEDDIHELLQEGDGDAAA